MPPQFVVNTPGCDVEEAGCFALVAAGAFQCNRNQNALADIERLIQPAVRQIDEPVKLPARFHFKIPEGGSIQPSAPD
jgi:hypothetical protein